MVWLVGYGAETQFSTSRQLLICHFDRQRIYRKYAFDWGLYAVSCLETKITSHLPNIITRLTDKKFSCGIHRKCLSMTTQKHFLLLKTPTNVFVKNRGGGSCGSRPPMSRTGLKRPLTHLAVQLNFTLWKIRPLKCGPLSLCFWPHV